MSKEGTPGYPAPETACRLDNEYLLQSEASCKGLRALAKCVVVQLGLRDDTTTPTAYSSLHVNQRRMIRVDLRMSSGISGSIR